MNKIDNPNIWLQGGTEDPSQILPLDVPLIFQEPNLAPRNKGTYSVNKGANSANKGVALQPIHNPSARPSKGDAIPPTGPVLAFLTTD